MLPAIWQLFLATVSSRLPSERADGASLPGVAPCKASLISDRPTSNLRRSRPRPLLYVHLVNPAAALVDCAAPAATCVFGLCGSRPRTPRAAPLRPIPGHSAPAMDPHTEMDCRGGGGGGGGAYRGPLAGAPVHCFSHQWRSLLICGFVCRAAQRSCDQQSCDNAQCL